jgi:glutathione S-transferase
VFNDEEPPRSGWAEIITLAERLGGRRMLVPVDPEARVRMFGLAHELAGEGGLGWSSRFIMIDGSFKSDGQEGFPPSIAQSLARKYGYAPGGADTARARVTEVLAIFDEQLGRALAVGHRYLLGAVPTALDVYLATFLTPIVGVSEADCPGMDATLRSAFRYLNAQVGGLVSRTLAEHRLMLFERHLGWPIVL